MRRAVKIEIERFEGRPSECVKKTLEGEDLWKRANRELLFWSLSAPKTGGYDKCGAKVTYEDGETYEARLDLQHPSCSDDPDNDLAKHMRRFCECYALVRIPTSYLADPKKEAAFRRHVLEDCPNAHAEAKRFLAEYEMGDAATAA